MSNPYRTAAPAPEPRGKVTPCHVKQMILAHCGAKQPDRVRLSLDMLHDLSLELAGDGETTDSIGGVTLLGPHGPIPVEYDPLAAPDTVHFVWGES